MKKLLFTFMACFVALAANAWSVKFTNPDNWSTVKVYVFGANAAGPAATWSGAAMTKGSDGLWSYEYSGNAPANIIFNNGSGSQTGDLTFGAANDGKTFDKNGPLGAVLNDYSIYFDNSKTKWSKVYLYAWDGVSTAGWPGDEVTKVDERGYYVFEYKAASPPSSNAKCIWNNGSGVQTANLTYEPGAVYDKDGPMNAQEETYTVYFNNTAGWSEVWVYTFSPELAGSWPGTKLTANADGTYQWDYVSKVTPSCDGIIFNNGGNGAQTDDLTYVVGQTYNNGSGTTDEGDWWYNLSGSFNAFGSDNGIQPKTEEIVKWENIKLYTLGTDAQPSEIGEFEIKVWDGTQDTFFGTGGAIALDEWISCTKDGGHMHIANNNADCVFTIQYNVKSNQIFVTLTSGELSGGEDPDPDPDPDGETETVKAQFDFSTFEGMQACYPNLPDSSDWTADGSTGNAYLAVTSLTQDGITIESNKGTATAAANIPKFYKTSAGAYTFRVYNGNTFTVTAPKGGNLTSIQLVCASATTSTNAQKITASAGELVVNGDNSRQMDWTAPEGGVESVTFSPTATTMIYLGFTVNATKPVATTDFEVMGSYNDDSSWQTPIKFTAYDNGVYSTATIEKLVEFKLVENGTWYGKETEGYAVLGEPFTMKAGDEYGNAAFGLSGYVQDAVISFNPTTMEVTVTGTWVDTALKLYIRGDMNNWGNDGLTEADALTTTDGNVYTITLPSLESGVIFKIASENWSPEFTTNNTAMTNGEYDIVPGNNMALGVSMTNVTLTLDINAKKLTVSGTESGFTDLYLRGTMNDWDASADWKFDTEDGENYTLANVNIPADATFKVSNAGWTDSLTYTYTASAIAPNTEYTLENNLEDNANMWLSEAIVNGTVTYNINTHAFKIAVAGVSSGVEGIEADEADAEYFNLQGVKVANPEKGIYVRVLNGKAVKVVK